MGRSRIPAVRTGVRDVADTFAADWERVKSGGGNTDDVSRNIEGTSDWYSETTWSLDPTKSVWGHDTAGREAEEKYLPTQHQLRDAVALFAQAVAGAAQRTVNAGRDFEDAQSDALDAINTEGGGTSGRRP